MSKDDVAELPAVVPRKARQLEAVPDVWIARWLAGDAITPSERRRLEELKAKRKTPVREHRVGLIVPKAGLAPVQLATMLVLLQTAGATEVHHGGVPSKLHNAARDIGVVHHQEPGWRFSPERDKEVVRSVDAVIAAPKESTVQTHATPGVWTAIGYAKHRGLPVKIVMPNGEVM